MANAKNLMARLFIWNLLILLTFIGQSSFSATDIPENQSLTIRRQVAKSCAPSLSIPSRVMGEIKSAMTEIRRREEEVIRAGGITPDIFRSIKPGDEIGFPDGAKFIVEKIEFLTNGFVKVSVQSHNIKNLELDVQNFDLIVPSYSGDNIALQVIGEGLPAQNSRTTLQFMRENMSDLQSRIPLRRFVRIDPTGMYAIAEKIPDFKGRLMTLEQFISDKDLSPQDRQLLADKLEIFLQTVLNIRFSILNLKTALVFDPRDSQWKFVIADSDVRTFVGDNFVQAVQIAIEFGKPADPDFFGKFYRALGELKWDVEDLARAANNKKRYQYVAKYGGTYSVEFTLESGQRIVGELDLSSLNNEKGEKVQFTGKLLDATGKTIAETKKSLPFDSIRINEERVATHFNNLFEGQETQPKYFDVTLPTLGANQSQVTEINSHRGPISNSEWGKVGSSKFTRIK